MVDLGAQECNISARGLNSNFGQKGRLIFKSRAPAKAAFNLVSERSTDPSIGLVRAFVLAEHWPE